MRNSTHNMSSYIWNNNWFFMHSIHSVMYYWLTNKSRKSTFKCNIIGDVILLGLSEGERIWYRFILVSNNEFSQKHKLYFNDCSRNYLFLSNTCELATNVCCINQLSMNVMYAFECLKHQQNEWMEIV